MPIASGLNADVIANGVGPAASSTSIDIDGVNYNYISTDYQLTASSTPLTYGIPANGLINSIVPETPGLWYQMAPFSENNSLRLEAGDVTGTITFSTPIPAIKLYMLAVTGSGAGTANVVVNFDDDTSQTFNGVSIPDWFGATNPPPAIMGIGRINRNTDGLEPNATNPRMYQITLAISEANQSKLIESVQVTQVPTGGEVVNVLAFSAEVYTSCPAPTDIAAVSTDDGATISWDTPEIIPSDGFEYYVSESSEIPGDDVTLEALDSDDTSVSVSGYDTGETYYFWIRSNCGDEKGFWRFVTFTTGQMSFVYTEGDISSDYFDEQFGINPVTITDENACPGEMSVVVPAGYQIASVATSYSISSTNNAYQNEQRSLLVCTTNDETESTITIGPSVNAIGVVPYNRTGLDIADGLTGTVNFELRVWRSWGNSSDYDVDCGVQYAKVIDGTWTITITYAPLEGGCDLDAPTAEDQEFCGSITVADLSAEGEEGAEFHWYTTEDGEEELGDDYEIEPGTYYVSQSVEDCESDRTAVEITATVTPAPEPAEEVMVCEGTTVFDLPSGALDGADAHWYAEEEGGEPLEDVEVESGTYYVSQSIEGCESERVAVEIMTVEIEAPEDGEIVEVCENTTIADMLEGTEDFIIYFYVSADAEEALPETTVIETGTYFVSIGLMDCMSERVEVEFIVITNEAPEPAPEQTVCGDATVTQLDPGVDGEAAIIWFDEEGEEMGPEDILINGSTYYVARTSELCGNSESAPVTVTVNPVPAEPVGDEQQEFTAGETIADLEVDFIEGASVQWFMLDEDVWIEVNPADALVDGGVYYVTQTIDDCTSDYLTITVDEVLGTDSFDRAHLSIYPNPASEMINVSYNAMLDKLVVNNLLGQEVMRQPVTGNAAEVNLSRLSQGTYLLQVYAADGSFTTVKIVKQ